MSPRSYAGWNGQPEGDVSRLDVEYRARAATWRAATVRLVRFHASAWWARVATSLLLALGLVLAAHGRLESAWALVPVGLVVLVHLAEQVLERRLDAARRATALYENAIARLEGRWEPVPFTGAEFVAPGHLFAGDLDLVGDRSLFARMSTARTEPGARALARWLLEPADDSTLRRRREAVEELRGRLDLRERLWLAGSAGVVKIDVAAVAAWGRAAAGALATWLRWPLRLAAWGLVGACLGAAGRWWGVAPALAAGLIVVVLHASLHRRASAVVLAVLAPLRQLAPIGSLAAVVEREAFKAPLLRELQATLAASGPSASRLARLRRSVDRLLSMRHELAAAVGFPLLWPAREAVEIEAWRRDFGPSLGEWLEAVGTFEALSSIATYADEHPTHRHAEVVPGGPLFHAEGLGHPLLDEGACVLNDLHLGGTAPDLLLLSGSNMSGKSTLIRAVGLSASMGLAGIPVRATRLRLAPMAIGASVRVQDSLLEGESRFYAEITRLKGVVGLVGGPLPVLFLFDEILSGTNSHDRQAGASGILTDLVSRGAIGICSTHDLALARVAEKLGGRAWNAHFRDTMLAGRLSFDYKLKQGVVAQTNALELMRAVGLNVDVAPAEVE